LVPVCMKTSHILDRECSGHRVLYLFIYMYILRHILCFFRLAAASDINYVACPGSVILSTTKTGRHDIAESGVKHQNSNNNQ
jgi:hypothetical protein